MFSRRIFIDIWISVFMAMTLTFFALSERFPERRRLLLILMYVSVGLGVLTKGPIAAVLPAIVFAGYLIACRELRRARTMMIPQGVLIVVAIVAPWYIALYQRDGWTDIVSFFIGENVGRYTTGIGFQSPRGPAFYLPVVFADAFPLSLFLIAAGVLWWRDRTSHVACEHVARRTSHLLWLWIVVIVAFFSFSHDKQDLYILPVVPAVAALGAAAIARREQIPRIVWGTSLLLALLLAAAGTAMLYVIQSPGQVYRLEGARLLGAVAAVGGILSAMLVMARRVMGGLVAALITLLAANWLLVAKILPGLEPHKPVPALTAFLRPRATPQDVLATYNVALPSLVFYLQRHVNVYYAPEPFVNDASATQRMFGVLSENDYAALQDRIGAKTCVVHRVPAFEMKLKQVLARAPAAESRPHHQSMRGTLSPSIPVRYVTLAYGEEDPVYRHASMLLLSLIAFAPEPRELVVVTDHPERFQWFDGVARIDHVTTQQLTEWRGRDPFSMRQKLEVARAAAPEQGALVMLDADTLAARDLTPMVEALAARAVFLHKREFELGYSRRRGNLALWKEISSRTFAGWYFRPGDAMWNSGVIAMPAADAPLIDQALLLYDAVADAGIRHFATEQLVAGQVLGRTQRLREAGVWITHYWGNKNRFDQEIARRLSEAKAAGMSPRRGRRGFPQEPDQSSG